MEKFRSIFGMEFEQLFRQCCRLLRQGIYKEEVSGEMIYLILVLFGLKWQVVDTIGMYIDLWISLEFRRQVQGWSNGWGFGMYICSGSTGGMRFFYNGV